MDNIVIVVDAQLTGYSNNSIWEMSDFFVFWSWNLRQQFQLQMNEKHRQTIQQYTWYRLNMLKQTLYQRVLLAEIWIAKGVVLDISSMSGQSRRRP